MNVAIDQTGIQNVSNLFRCQLRELEQPKDDTSDCHGFNRIAEAINSTLVTLWYLIAGATVDPASDLERCSELWRQYRDLITTGIDSLSSAKIAHPGCALSGVYDKALDLLNSTNERIRMTDRMIACRRNPHLDQLFPKTS
jgi:hypothetical protein